MSINWDLIQTPPQFGEREENIQLAVDGISARGHVVAFSKDLAVMQPRGGQPLKGRSVAIYFKTAVRSSEISFLPRAVALLSFMKMLCLCQFYYILALQYQLQHASQQCVQY
jgi:hypothetical protein